MGEGPLKVITEFTNWESARVGLAAKQEQGLLRLPDLRPAIECSAQVLLALTRNSKGDYNLHLRARLQGELNSYIFQVQHITRANSCRGVKGLKRQHHDLPAPSVATAPR